MQEADKVLKKQKDFSCAKVLKSLALLRLNRTSDATSLLDEVRSTNPTEDATLQAITTFYRDTNQPEMVADMYEKAVAKDPSNEELLSHLFMSYVRLGNYKKQQQVALNLYKLKPKNPYYFWSVVSLYLQAINTSDSSDAPANTKSLLLKLAEKKVEKFISEGKIEAEAEVELYLMILEAQEKYADMLATMDGTLGKFIRSVPFLNHRKAVLHRKIGQNEAAFHLICTELDVHPDQLSYYLELIELAIELDSERKEVRYLSHVLELLNGQIARHAKNKVRGPYLAKIELKYQIESSGELKFDISSIISSIGPVAKLIDEMYNEFGHKMPFYLDIGYLESKYPSFIDECANWFKSFDSPLKSYEAATYSSDEMKRHFTVILLDHHLNQSSRSLDSFGKLVKLYFDNLKYGEGLPSSDINPSDFYALVAISCIFEQLNDHKEYIMPLVNLCYTCSNRSPSNHTIKLLLVILLNSVGAISPSLKLFKSLDTKYIQTDTLSYIITRRFNSTGKVVVANTFTKASSKFYSRTGRDTNDFTISCYKFGSFGKISEINTVRSRIKNSLQHLIVRIDRIFSSLIIETTEQYPLSTLCNDIQELASNTPKLDELVDNRDVRTFGVLPHHLQNLLEEWKKYSFDIDCHWYYIRGLMLQSILLFNNLHEDNKIENLNQLTSLVKQLKCLKEKCITLFSSYKDIRVQPYVPGIMSFINGNFFDLFVNFLERISTLFSPQSSGDSNGKNSNGLTSSSLFDDTVKILGQLVEEITNMGTKVNIENVSCVLEKISNLTETVALIVSLIWVVSYKKGTTVTTGNKGKKKSSSSSSVAFASLANFSSSLKETLNKVKSYISDLSVEDEPPIDRLGPLIGDSIDPKVSYNCFLLNKMSSNN